MSNSNYFSNPIPKLQKINPKPIQHEIYESFEEISDSTQKFPSSQIDNSKQDNEQSAIQLQAQVAELKLEYQEKLKEIDHLYKEILKRDEDIKNFNQKDTIMKEEGILKMSYMKKMKQLERDSNEKLQHDLLILKDEYQLEIQAISEEHDEKVKKIQDDINELKNQIELYNNKQNYISKEEHDTIIFDLKNRHQKELEPFEREIAELEQYISDNYPQMIMNKDNKISSAPTNEHLEFLENDSDMNVSKDNSNIKSELNTINNSCSINQTPSDSCIVDSNGLYNNNRYDNNKNQYKNH